MDGGSLSWKNVHVLWGGIRLTGRAKGTVVSVVFNAEANREVVGIDGIGYFSMSDDISARFTVVLNLAADHNDILSADLNADRGSPFGIKKPLVIEDLNGRTVMASPAAKINKFPDVTYSDGEESRSWVFVATRVYGVVGGLNPTPNQ